MGLASAITFLLLAAASDDGWEEATKEDGMTVYSRLKEGQSVAEMKAVGTIDASPHEIWRAIRDYDNYSKTMPYTEVSKVVTVEGAGKVTYFYSVVNAPLVDRRDYLIRLVDESDWKDGKGYLLVTWAASDQGPAQKPGLVRVKLNNGYWKLEPRDGGKRTFATYYVHTDPGGAIPKFIANKANTVGVPNVFKAIKKVIADERAKAKP